MQAWVFIPKTKAREISELSERVSNIGFMQGRLSPMRNGRIQSFPWGHWENEFILAGVLGFKVMEWTIDSENFSENPLLTAGGQSAINQLSQQYDIQIPSVTCDYFMENPFWKSNTTLTHDNLIRILDGMHFIGAKILIIPLVDNSSLTGLAQIKKSVRFFSALESKLFENGLQIAFESDFNPRELSAYISNFNPNFFGINYDIGNSACFGFNPTEEFEAYAARIVNIHVKDRALGGTTLPLGEGAAEFPKIFDLLKTYSYRGNLIMQTARSAEGKHAEVLIKYRSMIREWMRASSDVN